MSLTNTIKEMQEQGITDENIIQELQAQGLSPLEINQALEQSKIKSAVDENNLYPSISTQESNEQQALIQQQSQEQYAPQQTQELPQEQVQQYPQYQEYQAYPQQSPDMITEITDQIVEEKLSKIKKIILAVEDFKTTFTRKTENIDERLKRIESIIDKLQSAIIGKVGLYGESLEDIKGEMRMMQESFSKALPSLAEKSSKKQASGKEEHKRKSDGFEHYLRS